ncbi:hypothetical protein TNIN_32541 [Trichonephila inaurata madagascariensis]|uniref:Uncharacterized protein n=1 Tax=Trichonephila inaurata madagascariensis TaxID=2747483 RepID=A0A8X7CAW8_9ARAC|nr:hypothetical protein TNIN_32541 [Trichonephila inaurata madagascariensis]
MKTTSILELGASTTTTAKTEVGWKIRHFQTNSQILWCMADAIDFFVFVQTPIYRSVSEPQSLSIRVQSSISTSQESIRILKTHVSAYNTMGLLKTLRIKRYPLLNEIKSQYFQQFLRNFYINVGNMSFKRSFLVIYKYETN